MKVPWTRSIVTTGPLLYLLIFAPIRAEQGVSPASGRRPLFPPELIEFRPADHFTDDYKSRQEAIAEELSFLGDPVLVDSAASLLSTLRQDRLLRLADDLAERVSTVDPSGQPERQQRLGRILENTAELRSLIAKGRYVAGYPFEMEAELDKRRYRFTWWEWTGESFSDEVTRFEPFVPLLTATVTGRYDAPSGTFAYELTNHVSSEAPLAELWIEIVGLTRARLSLWDQSRRSRIISSRDYTVYTLRPGDGYLQDYIFRRLKNEELAPVFPGESFEFPPVLSVPWPSLPGVVTCWVRVAGYQPRLSSHSDPPNIADFFVGVGLFTKGLPGQEKSVPRFPYHGKTIGPVPVPENFDPGEFLERLNSYVGVSLEWGWLSQEQADWLRPQLGQFQTQPEQVEGLIDTLTSLAARSLLTPEAEALFVRNLEYFKVQTAGR